MPLLGSGERRWGLLEKVGVLLGFCLTLDQFPLFPVHQEEAPVLHAPCHHDALPNTWSSTAAH